jgi:CheY-like chemotaxis protein
MASARKKVLWVDDEIEFLRSHIMFLETRGYSVIPVFSGDDAISVIHEKPKEFDIVLLDEQMPGKDGLTTLEEIKEYEPDLPVVMVTKSEEEQVMEEAIGKKIDGYLTKPVNPSQILSVCKRLLDSKKIISSQITRKYVRSYSDIRQVLSGQLNPQDWAKLYERLTLWDFTLEKVEDEGLRQTHTGQKSDCNEQFARYIVDNYTSWVQGNTEEPPVLSPMVFNRYVAPELKKGNRVVFMFLNCMRLDQFLAVESMLKKYFEIERNYYYSILPTSTTFAANALFSGLYPSQIAGQYPGVLHINEEQGDIDDTEIATMIDDNLKRCSVSLKEKPPVYSMSDKDSVKEVLANFDSLRSKQFVSLLVNFISLLTQGRSFSSVLHEIAPDEGAFRALTLSWFQHSPIFQLLKEFSRQDCVVILATDHGSVLCTRGTELYGSGDSMTTLRYRCGENISCDERHALFLADPTRCMIPAETKDTCCIIARENYYFVQPDKFENYQHQYKNSFLYGGISMDEVIVPVAIMRPK